MEITEDFFKSELATAYSLALTKKVGKDVSREELERHNAEGVEYAEGVLSLMKRMRLVT